MINTTKELALMTVFFSSKLTFLFLPEIWDALRAAADSDLELAQTIVDSAGIIVSSSDMTLCYDERGILYMTFPISCSTYHHFV